MDHPAEGLRFAFGESRYLGREKFGPLLGGQLEIVYIQTGQVLVIADNAQFEVAAPAMLLAATLRHLEYRYRSDDVCDVLWCQCTGPDLTPGILAPFLPLAGVLPVSEASQGLMRLGAGLSLQVVDDMPEVVSGLARTLLTEVMIRQRRGTPAPAISPRVSAIRRYLEGNLGKTIGMRWLSETFSLSPQHINRLFQAAYGMNALDYLWHLRVRRGAFMLRHTGMHISQIGYLTGFKTPTHFSRLIKAEYGLSPRELRTHNWEGGAAAGRDGGEDPEK